MDKELTIIAEPEELIAWADTFDIQQYMNNRARRARAVRSQFYNTGIQVHLNKMSMEWFIENKSMDSGKDIYPISSTITKYSTDDF